MSTQEITAEAMALPLRDRVALAHVLWASIEAGLADTDEDSAVREAIQRDEELASGSVTGRTHGRSCSLRVEFLSGADADLQGFSSDWKITETDSASSS